MRQLSAYQPGCPSPGLRPSDQSLPLLAPDELLRAIAGRASDGSPLVGWARELGDLHAELVRFRLGRVPQGSDFDDDRVRSEIDRLMGEIDTWAVRHILWTKCGRMYTHSLGEVMGHIAKMYAEAWWTVLHTADADQWHDVWVRLSEVREGYAYMVDEIRSGRLQLPLGLCVIPAPGVG
ncbi:hypothetical protein [Nocardia exalbida]|uniref:hypothetical protein n=1 Tax=Nocardia exalbida TaxID=290231 RepID=UPI0012F62C5A|nr:hypothetical protein [Nocardia exalbida]